MSQFSIGLAGSSDFEAILALQDQNHFNQIAEANLADGFVTTQLTDQALEAMRANTGLLVARTGSGELLAYACANDWDFYGESPFQNSARALLPLEFDGRAITTQNSFQYGPVCVAASFRGQGVLPALLKAICHSAAPRFEFGICFIDTRNIRSLEAHERKLGFRRMGLLPFGNVIYHMMAFKTTALCKG